jgi:hypothetical protein
MTRKAGASTDVAQSVRLRMPQKYENSGNAQTNSLRHLGGRMTNDSLKQKAQKAANEAKASAPPSPPRPVTPRPDLQKIPDVKETNE